MAGQQQNMTSMSLVRSIVGVAVTFSVASAVLYYLLSLVAKQLSMRYVLCKDNVYFKGIWFWYT